MLRQPGLLPRQALAAVSGKSLIRHGIPPAALIAAYLAFGLVEHFMVEAVIKAEALVFSLRLVVKRAAGVHCRDAIGRAMKYEQRDSDFHELFLGHLGGAQNLGAGTHGKAAMEDQWIISKLTHHLLVAGDIPTAHAD